MRVAYHKQQDLVYLVANSMNLLFAILLFSFLESIASKKIADEMAAITSRLGIFLQQTKILQPGEYAAKLDLSGDVRKRAA
jgi:hypothetical protein